MNDLAAFSTADENAIRGLVQQMQDGWNAHDGNAFAAPFAEDADYVVVNGRHIRGREGIAMGHVQLFESAYRDSHNEYTVERIRPLRDDVALAHAHAHLVVRSGDETQEAHARFSIVAVKNDGRWQVAAFHNTGIREPGA